MAKINIPFGDTTYSIDESTLASAASALKSHLSTAMNGSGATISLGGTSYNVDSAKLSSATNEFIAHLATVAGSGHKVVVGGVEHGVASDKMQNAIAELHTVLGGLQSGGSSTWEAKTWSGLTNVSGQNVWTDGDNIYCSSGTSQYVLK